MHDVSPPQPPQLRVGFLLARRFTLSAFANFVDVLRLAADEGDRSRPIRCSWRVLSPSSDPVLSSCGIGVTPDEKPGDPRRFDYLVVVGGLRDEIDRPHPDHFAFLHRAAQVGVPLVGVCTGSFILHEAGLMADHRCCVSWFHHEDFLERFEGLRPVSDRIFVVDRDRLTCSGGVSAAHLAAFLVDRHIGRAVARKSLHIMMIDEAMPADEPQPGLPLELKAADPLVRRALLMVQQSMESPPDVSEVAARLQISRRKLERHFAAALAMPPAAAFLLVRLGQAKLLLARSERTISQIAAETGFCDASHLIRVFRERMGTTPEAWRRMAEPETVVVAEALNPADIVSPVPIM